MVKNHFEYTKIWISFTKTVKRKRSDMKSDDQLTTVQNLPKSSHKLPISSGATFINHSNTRTLMNVRSQRGNPAVVVDMPISRSSPPSWPQGARFWTVAKRSAGPHDSSGPRAEKLAPLPATDNETLPKGTLRSKPVLKRRTREYVIEFSHDWYTWGA